MKVIFTGTKHPNEVEIEAILIYEGENTWTFELPTVKFTISDLSDAMDYLEEDYRRAIKQ